MRRGVLAFLFLALTPLRAAGPLAQVLDRVSEEAEVFRRLAPKIVARETLHQKARPRRRRFRLRIGKDALQPPLIRYQHREIISEYGFTHFREAPEALHELRQVVSVDGRPVTGHEKARETLTLGVTTSDDRLKKNLLRRFEKHGLVGATTDFGQLILLFRRPNLPRYEFHQLREAFLGADPVLVLGYRQREGPEAFTIFAGRTATRARLEGELWVRKSDFVPLRITLNTTVAGDKHATTHRATVDYFPSAYGVILPAAVDYEELTDGRLVVENVATYSNYHLFSVHTEIRFGPAERPR